MKEKNEIQERIYKTLSVSHRGRRKSVSARALAEAVGLDERSLRDEVSRLVLDHRAAIGSHPSAGFFWIVDRADRDLAARHLLPRGKKIIARYAVIAGVPVEQAAKQMALFDGADK